MITKTLLSLLFISYVTSQELVGDAFVHTAYLDYDKTFQMKWNYNETHIIIEMKGKTNGWIGIGFSENGNMVNADMHVGWVKNGKAFITDRHGLSFNTFPPLDAEQNLQLIRGSECDGETVIVFIRQLAACQNGQDRSISFDTARTIYAFGATDPNDDEITSEDYHGLNRGASSLFLFEKQEAPPVTDEDAQSFELRSSDELLPRDLTYYQCRLLELPRLGKKHHIIRIEPIINETFLANIHHIVVYECTNPVNPEDVGTSGQCYTPQVQSFRTCHRKVFAAWGVGGGATTLPDHVGLPFSETDKRVFVNLEIHYDNPNRIDIRDNSGIKLIYTPNLRQHDAGVMDLGHVTSGFLLVVPPHLEKFEVEGGCGAACISGAMRLAGVEEIHIVNIFLHSHLAGRKLRLRHIRNGVELPFIAKDDSYDFDYQRERVLRPERTVRIGDELMTVCEYTSMGRNKPIVGGLETTQEMCLSFFVYYPRIPLDICLSGPSGITSIMYETLGIKEVREIKSKDKTLTRSISDRLVTAPIDKANLTVADVMSRYPWNNESGKTFERRLKSSFRLQWCVGPQPNVTIFSHRAPIQVRESYEEPTMTCVAPFIGFENNVDVTACNDV